MATSTAPAIVYSPEMRLRMIAREIAIDVLPHEVIFEQFKVGKAEWDRLSTDPKFMSILEEEMVSWNTTMNVRERIDLKSLTMYEAWLEQAQKYFHDKDFADNAKVELFKAMQKAIGIGNKDAQVGEGNRVSITINMGEDKQLTVEHKIPTIDVTDYNEG